MKQKASLLGILITLLLFSCTILDNDLRDLPDTPGFKEVVHEESDTYKVDYQYQETTRVLDDRTLGYIVGVDYGEAKLYMRETTPDDILPTIGQVMHHGVCDELPYGICHRATAISRENDFYAISLERAALNDVFKTLVLESNVEVAGDFQEEEIDSTALAEARVKTRESGDAELDWCDFDLLKLLPGVNSSTVHFESNTEDIKGYVDLTGSLLLRWRPILKATSNIDIDKDQFDMSAQIGTEWEIKPTLSGKAGIKMDLISMASPALKNALSGQIPIYPPLAIFLTYSFELEYDISFSGSISTTISKKSYITVGGRNNIKGKDDGPYLSKKDSPVKYEMTPDNSSNWKWGGGFDFETYLMGGAEIRLLLGSPKEFPNVGLGIKGLIGPRIRTTYSGNIQEDYYKVLRTSIGAKFEAKLFLNIFKNLSFDWDFADAIAKYLGRSEGTAVDIPGTVHDARLYPAFSNFAVECLNPMESGTPRFDLHFSVAEGGLYVAWERTAQPVVKIFPHSTSGEPLLMKSDFSEVSMQSLKKPNTYSWVIADSKLKRDEVYDAEISIPNENGTKYICSVRYPFTSTSPSAVITYDQMVAQEERVSTKGKKTSTPNVLSYKTYYDYKFMTVFSLTEEKSISSWGLEINGKDYPIEGTPKSKQVVVLMAIKNSQKKERTVKITPYIKFYKNTELLTSSQPTSKVIVSYDPSLNTYTDVRRGEYKCSGFDDSDRITADVDLSEKNLKARTTRSNTSSGEEADDDTEMEVEILGAWPLK